MNTRHPRAGGRAFALLELSAAIVLVVVAVVLSSIVIPDARRRARLAGSIQNLRQLGAAAGEFAADNDDRLFSLNWEPGNHECGGYVFPESSHYNDSSADEAVCLIRRYSGRGDIEAIRAWHANLFYNTLVLTEYLGGKLPDPVMVSPGDAPRLAWRRAVTQDPADPNTPYFNLACRPTGTGNSAKRWPYSSSYEMQPSMYSPDARIDTPQGPIPTVAQDPSGHRYFVVGSAATVYGQRTMSEVAFPSQKGVLYETAQRFFGARELYFMYPESRIPVLHADGSAFVRQMARANLGFSPNVPLATAPVRVDYVPETSWEPPTRNGSAAELVNGLIRWTRSGLRGRDFQGPEVPWVP